MVLADTEGIFPVAQDRSEWCTEEGTRLLRLCIAASPSRGGGEIPGRQVLSELFGRLQILASSAFSSRPTERVRRLRRIPYAGRTETSIKQHARRSRSRALVVNGGGIGGPYVRDTVGNVSPSTTIRRLNGEPSPVPHDTLTGSSDMNQKARYSAHLPVRL